MASLKGTPTKLFVAGIPLLLAGAILYFWSEQLGGAENVQRGKNLETAAIVIFLLGVACWVGMMITGFKGKKK